MDAEKVKKLLEFDTPTVANGIELMDVRDPCVGYTGPDVRSLMPDFGARVGIAITGRMDTTTAGTDNPPSLFNDWLRLMQEAVRGPGGGILPVFAVLESVGPRPRYTVTIGDGMGTRMKLAGADAFLTNGSIRDLDGVRAVPLACWAAGLSPMHGRIRWLDIGTPVVIDGMVVRSGDIIHADVNGALVIPPETADQVYDQAKIVREREQAMFARLSKPGLTLDELLSSGR
jgi:4-hydroxy-4-methyl-2-oxoglutarate aldolase